MDQAVIYLTWYNLYSNLPCTDVPMPQRIQDISRVMFFRPMACLSFYLALALFE